MTSKQEEKLNCFCRELRQIKGEMMNDMASYPSWFQYGGQRLPNNFWPRKGLIKENKNADNYL